MHSPAKPSMQLGTTTPDPKKWVPSPTNFLSGTRIFTFSSGGGPPRAKDLDPDGSFNYLNSPKDPPEKEYTLLGEVVTDVDSICTLLQKWMKGRQSDGPTPEDREAVALFFKKLILEENNQRKACECVHTFKYVLIEIFQCEAAWIATAEYLMDVVNSAIRAMGRPPIQFQELQSFDIYNV